MATPASPPSLRRFVSPVVFLLALALVGCTPAPEEADRWAACDDTIKNSSETDVDCGGSCGATCVTGETCASAADCAEHVCSQTLHTCTAPTCFDGIKNGTEGDVDCGGTCALKCALGSTCSVASDCAINTCNSAGICMEEPCADGCGGDCVLICNGEYCEQDDECFSGNCHPSGGPWICF